MVKKNTNYKSGHEDLEVENLMQQYDLETSRLRQLTGKMAIIAAIIAISMSIFQTYTAGWGTLITLRQRSLHIIFAFVLGFIFFPGSQDIFKSEEKLGIKGHIENFTMGDVFFLSVYALFFSALYMEILIKIVAIPLGIISSFFLYSGYRRSRKDKIDPLDVIYILLTIVVFGYIFFNYKAISIKAAEYTNIDLILGGLAVLLTLEVTRRVVGPELPIVSIIFIFYAYFGQYLPGVLAHRGYTVGRIISQMYLTTEGIMGIPLGVSATFVFMFILFGAFLDKTGVGKFFIDIAYALTGHLKSGPAMTAVLASGFMGSISGSSVANTVTTGAFTIPLMIDSGYKPHFAGAVEATASTGGQIMPPVMGAAAFIMAEFTGIAYKDIIVAALIPAVLYYFAVAVTVHLEASKLGLKGLPREELPKASVVMKSKGYLLLPLVVIVGFLIKGLTPTFSAYYAILFSIIIALIASMIKGENSFAKEKTMPLVAAIFLFTQDLIPSISDGIIQLIIIGLISVVSTLLIAFISSKFNKDKNLEEELKKEEEIDFNMGKILEAFEAGAKGAVGVACACACAGIIVCVVTLTGLGLRIAGIIVSAAGGNLILTLFFTMIASIILGMGLPTTAKYIVLATMAVPALIQLEVNLMSAHLFILYFGVIADITPPVALAAYAGAGIAGANSMRTGFSALKIALAGFIVPYLFAMNPELLLIESINETVVNFLPFTAAIGIIISALIGIVCLASGVQGHFLTKTKIYERIALLGSAFLLLNPGLLTDSIGIVVLILIYILQNKRIDKLELA